MSGRNTIRVLANGRLYTAGHDAQLDDDRIPTFHMAVGATDIFEVDWSGWTYGNPVTSATWTATGGTISNAAVTAARATMTFTGLGEGQGAEIKCTAVSSGRVGVVKFRIMSPVGLIGIASIGVGSSGFFIEAEEGPLEP